MLLMLVTIMIALLFLLEWMGSEQEQTIVEVPIAIPANVAETE